MTSTETRSYKGAAHNARARDRKRGARGATAAQDKRRKARDWSEAATVGYGEELLASGRRVMATERRWRLQCSVIALGMAL